MAEKINNNIKDYNIPSLGTIADELNHDAIVIQMAIGMTDAARECAKQAAEKIGLNPENFTASGNNSIENIYDIAQAIVEEDITEPEYIMTFSWENAKDSEYSIDIAVGANHDNKKFEFMYKAYHTIKNVLYAYDTKKKEWKEIDQPIDDTIREMISKVASYTNGQYRLFHFLMQANENIESDYNPFESVENLKPLADIFNEYEYAEPYIININCENEPEQNIPCAVFPDESIAVAYRKDKKFSVFKCKKRSHDKYTINAIKFLSAEKDIDSIINKYIIRNIKLMA